MALGDYMGASCHACIGGTNVRAEVQKLQMEAPHIIVGTPGRVFDMLNRRYLCEYLRVLVLWVTSLFYMLSQSFHLTTIFPVRLVFPPKRVAL